MSGFETSLGERLRARIFVLSGATRHNAGVSFLHNFAWWTLGAALATVLTGCIAGHGLGAVPERPARETAASGARSDAAPPSKRAEPARKKRLELPLGGRQIFPQHRLVGFCGTPGAPALGKLASKLPKRAQEIEAIAKKYGDDRKVLPVFELIAVIVQGVPGADGKHRRRVSERVVDEYLEAAREAKALLLLNVQPGHSDFMTEIKVYEKYLREPDVGVALDPEWAMKPKQKPGVYYGQTKGSVINEVAEYLSGVVKEHDLPEKVLVYHQMNQHVVKDEEVVTPSPGVVLIKSVDGLGPKGAKLVTYNFLVRRLPPDVHAGFKLFFDEDTRNGSRLMSPAEVLALTPQPEYVMYE